MKRLPVVLLACGALDTVFNEDGFSAIFDQMIFLDGGMHLTPIRIKQALQERIDQIPEPSLIVLGYGLCGNGLDGIQAGLHTLLAPCADDCIALLMGSRERYQEEHKNNPRTYFLTKGFLDAGISPLSEYHHAAERHGEEKAAMIMDLQFRRYNRLVFVSHRSQDFETYRSQILPVAEYCQQWGMEFENYLGSLAFIEQLVEGVKEIAAGELPSSPGLIVVPPGGEISLMNYFPWEKL